MLRLLKKYTFGYHILPISKNSALVPGKSIIMSSYPGALSSHDEFYLIQEDSSEMIIVGTALTITNRSLQSFMNNRDQVMSSAKVMAANRLAANGYSWSHIMSLHNSTNAAKQWINVEPRDGIVWFVKQLSGFIRTVDISERFAGSNALWAIGENHHRAINMIISENEKEDNKNMLVLRLQNNITTTEHLRKLMREYNHERFAEEDQAQILSNREVLKEINVPFGIIDTKIILADIGGVKNFEVTSGPNISGSLQPFQWSTTFPNVSHLGHPDVFNFETVTPLWVWL